jgi:hypothetical protein
MKTLEKLREEYNNLNKKRNAIYKKIVELERQEVTNAFTVGECYVDTYCKSFKKVIALDGNVLYCVVINNENILRDFYYLYSTRYWKKITSEQFKDIYLAVLKDIQNPDLDDNKKSNWDIVSKSIMES